MGASASGESVVLYEARDGVAVLTLNRPDRLNAWTNEMQERFHDLLEEAAADPEVRVIVATGAGRGFCAGFDMDGLKGIGEGGKLPSRTSRPATYPISIPKPVIAAINGACAGIGLSVALACDMRFAAAGAKITTAFSRRGLVAEHGMSWILPRLVGPGRAADLLFSGRVVLAEEAHEMGLVDRLYPPDALLAETLAYARDLAVNSSPTSMATMKWQIWRHLGLEFGPALDESNALMLASFGKPDLAEGVSSFLERRAPRFPPVAGKPGDGGLAGEAGLVGEGRP